jgi:hypothetical protein
MKNYVMVLGLVLLVAHVAAQTNQPATPRTATPQDPISTILEAFRTRDIVALTDPHDIIQIQAFLLALIRDP